MGKTGDLSSRKKGQVKMLLEHNALKIVELAKTLNVLKRTVGRRNKKLRNNEDLEAKRAGKCGRKHKATPILDKNIVKMGLSNKRSSRRKISSGLAAQEFVVHRKTVYRKLCEGGLKAYRPRKKPRLTDKIKARRHVWAVEHSDWTSTDWELVKKVCLVHCGYDFNCILTKLFGRLFSRMN